MDVDAAVWQLLQRGLTVANMRQQAYAANVANAETPGYHRVDVAFEDQLQAALSTPPADETAGSANGLTGLNWQAALAVQPHWQQASGSIDNSGNNVDIDAEMAQLAQNQIRYNALVQDVRMRLDRWKNAIDGGG
ncbi:MAG: flagellar basal body rod protein FlgB [Alicyclobacillus sp.]|nr:flagellar basal body rod protein FlgB [Alicyclobacillus sp.]